MFKSLVHNNWIAVKRKGALPYGRLDIFRLVLDGSLPEAKSNFHVGASSRKPNLLYYVESWKDLLVFTQNSETYAEFFSLLLLGGVEPSKRRWAEKSPRNVYFARHFLDLFPDGRFLFLHRNPLDTIASLVNRAFAPKTLEQATLQYIRSVASYRQVANDPRVAIVEYEELVTDTERTLERAMRFLGEGLEFSQFNFYSTERKRDAGYARTEVHSDSVGRWRSDLSRSQYRTVAELLRRAGMGSLVQAWSKSS